MPFALFVAAVAAWADARAERIPNWLTYPAIGFGLAAGGWPAAAAAGLTVAWSGAMYAREKMGGGDVKLFVAVAALWPIGGAAAALVAVVLSHARLRVVCLAGPALFVALVLEVLVWGGT